MERVTRREFVTGAAALTLSVLGFSSSANAAPDFEDAGDEIERTAPMDELRKFMPYLRYESGSPSKDQLIGMYGWKATSPNYKTDAYYYWTRYTNQHAGAEYLGLFDKAVSALASDAHLWDHEPSITFVDPNTGEVDEVVFTGGHHAVDSSTSPPLIEDAANYPTHVSLEVVDPWHHYELDEEKRGADIRNLGEFESWLNVRDKWSKNGFYENSSNAAIDNPWVARERESWFEGRRDRLAAKLWQQF